MHSEEVVMKQIAKVRRKIASLIGITGLLLVMALGAAFAEDITILPGQTENPADGCEWLAVYGNFGSDQQAALDRINEIRLEACRQGIPDPRNSSRNLTEADYVPIKWSTELEKMARIRAVEAGFIIGHERHNGKSIWTAAYGVSSGAEVIAWNGSISMVPGINQWYGEKEDWVNACLGLEHGVTGHYTSMINPNNKYVGVGLFQASGILYGSAAVGEFSSSSATNLSQEFLPSYTGVYQKFDALRSYLGSYSLSVPAELCVGQQQSAITNVVFKRDGRNFNVRYLGTVQYQSDNTSVVTVDRNGKLLGKKAGSANITASVGGTQIGSAAITIVGGFNLSDTTVTLSPQKFQYDGTAKVPEVTVTHNGGKLVPGTDYTVRFSDNINVGTATATITGKGFYSGTKTVNYTIFCDHQGNFTRVAGEDKMEGDCSICHSHVYLDLPTSMTIWWKNELDEGSYWSSTPSDNPVGSKILCWFAEINGDPRYSEIVVECSDPTKLSGPSGASGPGGGDLKYTVLGNGIVTLTIYPKWNPEKKRTFRFALGTVDVADADISLTSTMTYTGEPRCPVPTVRVAGKLMENGTDYTLSYRNNINAGTATVTITGKGKLSGTTSRTFQILPKKISTSCYSLQGVSGSLGGEIQLEFYISVTESAYADVADIDPYVLFYTDKGNISKQYLKDLPTEVKSGKTCYKARCPVAAKKLSDTVRLAFFVNDNVQAQTTRSYVPKNYFNNLINGSYSAEIKAIAKAIITYSAYAREYFNYNTDTLSESDYLTALSGKGTVVSAISGDVSVSGESQHVVFDGISLMLLSDTGMRLYVIPDSYALNGNYGIVKGSDGRCYIPVTGAKFGNLGSVQTVNVCGMTVSASPLHYIKNVLRNSSNQKLINLCLAMYQCYVAAQAYQGQ